MPYFELRIIFTKSTMSEEFEFLCNQKGKLTLIRNGFQLNKNVTNKNGSSLWRCVNRRICTASVTIDKSRKTVLRESPHTCEQNVVLLEVKKIKSTLKKAVCADLGPIQKICEEPLKKLRKKCHKDEDLIPSFHSLKNSLYRSRKKFLDTDFLTHSSTSSVKIPEAFQSFLVCENGDIDKIIIFATNTAKKFIKTPGSYYADGTFRSTPKPFYQLFVIHLDVNSDKKTTNIVPVIYALLPNKLEATYVRLFTLIKEKLGVQIRTFKSDYEIAIMNAVSFVFPQATVTGCFHHYNDAI